MEDLPIGRLDNTGVFIGEAAGLIRDTQPAGDILQAMVARAETRAAAAELAARFGELRRGLAAASPPTIM